MRFAIRQSERTQGDFIDARAVFKTVQRVEIDHDVTRAVANVVETALGNAADQRHLAAFEPGTDRRTGARALAFAAATAGFAVTAGFTATEQFAAMFGAGTRL